jgi:hypothetical protein
VENFVNPVTNKTNLNSGQKPSGGVNGSLSPMKVNLETLNQLLGMVYGPGAPNSKIQIDPVKTKGILKENK